MLIMSLFSGSCRSWSCRSRVAGQTRQSKAAKLLKHWAISFVLPCVLDGFHTSGIPIRMGVHPLDQPEPSDKALWSWGTMSDARGLISAMNTHPNRNFEF